MAATSDDEMTSLLTSFDQIYEDFKSGMAEIQLLKWNYNAEFQRREALELNCNNLKQENERLSKLYSGSLSSLADQLDRRTKYQSLKEEFSRMINENRRKEDDYRKAMESLRTDFESRVRDLEAQVRGFLLEKATSEATVNHLRQDLAAHKTHAQAIAIKLESVQFEVESKYQLEVQDLKDSLLTEQEEKNELKKRLQHLEKELLISRTKMAEQQRNLASSRHIETLKLKIMTLRKENEALKRKLSGSQEC